MLAALTTLLVAASAAATTIRPVQLPFSHLGDGLALREALLKGEGLLQIADVPGFAELRKQALGAVHTCGQYAAETRFPDGAIRRTVASRTVPGPGGAQPFVFGPASSAPVAESLECLATAKVKLAGFRRTVDGVTRRFGDALANILPAAADGKPLMQTAGGHPFKTIADVVDWGDHLEHIHAYAPPPTPPATPEA
eukprot:g5717.t1